MDLATFYTLEALAGNLYQFTLILLIWGFLLYIVYNITNSL